MRQNDHCNMTTAALASRAVDARRNVKRAPIAQTKRQGNHFDGSADSRDQRVCELELENTVSAFRIAALEKVRAGLAQSLSSFEAFYQHSPIGCITLDQRGHIMGANRAAEALLGLSVTRLPRLPLALLVCSEDIPRFREHLARCRESGDDKVIMELQLRAKDRRPVRVQIASVAIRGAEQAAFLTSIVDLTERTRNEEKLAEAKEFSESIIETISQPLLVLDSDFRIVSVNRAFTQFFKQPAKYACGRAFDVVLNLWWNGNQLRTELEKVLVRNEPLENFQIEVEPRDLGKHFLLLNARRLQRKSDPRALLLVALEDITVRKEAEDQLYNLNQQLEERVIARTEALRKSYEQMEAFCYSIAHDLRAPLRSMAGFSHLLIEEHSAQLDATGKDYIERIQQSAAGMDRLIRDLLSYGSLTASNLDLLAVNVDELFDSVLARHREEIQERHAKITKKGPLPCVRGNPVVLETILVNLFSNAMKFVAPGIDPKISMWSEDRGIYSRLWIQDNGIGIAQAYHEKIFGVFQRLHSAERFPGTGIGLAIVQRGVERLGGRVGVESDLGKGSRFWIELQRQERSSQG